MFSMLDKLLIMAAVKTEDLLKATPAPDSALDGVTDKAKEFGAGGMELVNTVFVYVVGVCVLITAILMVVHARNRQKTGEIKDGLGWMILGIVLGFGAIGFIVFMETLAGGIF